VGPAPPNTPRPHGQDNTTLIQQQHTSLATSLNELRTTLERLQPRDAWFLTGQRRGVCLGLVVRRSRDLSWSLSEDSGLGHSARRTFHSPEALAAHLDSLDNLKTVEGPTNREAELESLTKRLGALRAGEALSLNGAHGIEHAMLTARRDGGTWRMALDLDDGDDLESLRASFSSPEDAAAWLTEQVDHWLV
jgi:hypothetical protein